VAARRAHLMETIQPALDRGKWVVCDRFADSTLAYQGYGKNVSLETLAALHRLIAGDFAPDLTLILDLPVKDGFARIKQRLGQENRFERMDRAFHERVRQGFLEIASREPRRCTIIDARREPAAIAAEIMRTIDIHLLSKSGQPADV
jgi:dTMP kinase